MFDNPQEVWIITIPQSPFTLVSCHSSLWPRLKGTIGVYPWDGQQDLSLTMPLHSGHSKSKLTKSGMRCFSRHSGSTHIPLDPFYHFCETLPWFGGSSASDVHICNCLQTPALQLLEPLWSHTQRARNAWELMTPSLLGLLVNDWLEQECESIASLPGAGTNSEII